MFFPRTKIFGEHQHKGTYEKSQSVLSTSMADAMTISRGGNLSGAHCIWGWALPEAVKGCGHSMWILDRTQGDKEPAKWI
jgi:hypothetical protein